MSGLRRVGQCTVLKLISPLVLALAFHGVAVAARSPIDALADEMLAGHGGPKGAMRLYAHAFAAYALVDAALDDEARAPATRRRLDGLIARVVERAMGSPFHAGEVRVSKHKLSRSVALRGHLALMLVGRRALGEMPDAETTLLNALVHGLAAEVIAAPGRLLPSYGARTWPADNEVLLAALALYLEGTPKDDAARAAHDALQTRLHSLEESELPPSEVRADGSQEVPRGCALSWTVAMRGLSDRDGAIQLYRRYRERFFVSLGPVHGFREWAPGIDRAADADSGEIVMGIGTAASGIGMAAARLTGSSDDERSLRQSAQLAGIDRIPTRTEGAWLVRAMTLWASSARPWRKPAP